MCKLMPCSITKENQLQIDWSETWSYDVIMQGRYRIYGIRMSDEIPEAGTQRTDHFV